MVFVPGQRLLIVFNSFSFLQARITLNMPRKSMLMLTLSAGMFFEDIFGYPLSIVVVFLVVSK